MTVEKRPFTFEEDFSLTPMDSGSYMLEQNLYFSRAFSNLEEVVAFLIAEKDKYLSRYGGGGGSYDGGYSTYVRPGSGGSRHDEEVRKQLYPNDYEPFDHTGLKKEDE